MAPALVCHDLKQVTAPFWISFFCKTLEGVELGNTRFSSPKEIRISSILRAGPLTTDGEGRI